jgi:hypothetical protein
MDVGDCGISSNYFQTLCEMPGMDVDDCGISSNYFRTLCEMPTDVVPSVWTSVNVAF